MSEPYVSVVATARNDNHGGDLLHRIQVFVNGIAAQAERFAIPMELVIVEWNPPEDRPPLAEAIEWPAETDFFSSRIIRVPAEIHMTLEYGARLPLFQMIAKNVGIRRARAPFVLATNVDVLLSDDLMTHIARRHLKPGRLYRADRTDTEAELDPFAPIDEQLTACSTRVVRICALEGTHDLRAGVYYQIYGPTTRWPGPLARWGRLIRFGVPFALRMVRRGFATMLLLAATVSLRVPRLWGSPRKLELAPWVRQLRWGSVFRGLRHLTTPEGRALWGTLLRSAVVAVPVRRPPRPPRARKAKPPVPPVMQSLALLLAFAAERKREIEQTWRWEKARVRLHTNACGDFTLLSRLDWERLRGYSEAEMFSMHLDSLLLYDAHYLGLKHVVLPGAVYHLEHDSGYKPDDAAIEALNTRLERAAIPQISNEEFLEHIMAMYSDRTPFSKNGPNWGFAQHTFEEVDPAIVSAETVR